MADKKLPMDLVTTYRKDFVKLVTQRPPLHHDEKEYPDLVSGPYTEYILPAHKWDQKPVPDAKHEHPDNFFKRMWESKEVMPTYTREAEECYCVKMLNKKPHMDPPDKSTVARHYDNKNKTMSKSITVVQMINMWH
ncbi:hypothetical protein L9F63_016267 [Diploptera punctata]|uniref:Uncharacterized protein n=1 Tax=Diploptera punctata TaxID=6984 RepID=A0AAD8A1P7_DIPPU|nr:hypothetical protein L9F63_016267 [Diploptera punctata]